MPTPAIRIADTLGLLSKLKRRIGAECYYWSLFALICIAVSVVYAGAAKIIGAETYLAYAGILVSLASAFLILAVLVGLLRTYVRILGPLWNGTLAAAAIAGVLTGLIGGIAYANDWPETAFHHPSDPPITKDAVIRITRYLVYGVVVSVVYGSVLAAFRAKWPAGQRHRVIAILSIILVVTIGVVAVSSQNIIESSLTRDILGPQTQGDAPYSIHVLVLGLFSLAMIGHANWQDRIHGVNFTRRLLFSILFLAATGIPLGYTFRGIGLGPVDGGWTRVILGMFLLLSWSII